MPTPASSVKFTIYESGEFPRVVTVFNPAQNIVYTDIMQEGTEVAVGIANLPDSPLKIDFRSQYDCSGFVAVLRQGLYDFNPTATPSADPLAPDTRNFSWPGSYAYTGTADSPLLLSNETTGTPTTTEAPTTTTTTGAPYDAVINWEFAQTASGLFSVYVNGALTDSTDVAATGTIGVYTGDTFYSTITGNGTDYYELNTQNPPNAIVVLSGSGNSTSSTYTVSTTDWTIYGQSGN